VAGEVWGDGAPIYLVHGWAGHRGQFAEFIRPLLARGQRVVAFDMPSHGESPPGAFGPGSSSFPEFTAALTAVVARYGRPRAIVAHSAGAVAAAGALCDGLAADRVVLLAPMAGGLPHLREFAAVMGFGERTLGRLVSRLEQRVGAPMSHFDVVELGRAVAMPPTLVIHDRGDRSTPVSDGAAIAAAWPGARLKVTSGLGHNRLLRSPEVVADVVDFITT
jgi:pimeloyl-ACP methyl ester carboxylesterase